MNASNLAVNLAMRSRKSSKPKSMLGSVSATEGPAGVIVWRPGPIDVDGSKAFDMVNAVSIFLEWLFPRRRIISKAWVSI
jgi:hypothetical protein